MTYSYMVEILCKLHVDILYRNYNVCFGIQYVYKDMYWLFNLHFIENKINNIHSVEVDKNRK